MQLYVAGCGGFGNDEASIAPLVKVYAVSYGQAFPLRDITPVADHSLYDLDLIQSVATDSRGFLYLASLQLLVVYAPQASGNDDPFQRLESNDYGADWLDSSFGLSVDRHDNLYVLHGTTTPFDTSNIAVFLAGASGPTVNPVPDYWLTGIAGWDLHMAIDTSGPTRDKIYVSEIKGIGDPPNKVTSIRRYDLPSAGPATAALTKAPTTITGPSSGLVTPTNMAFDAKGNLFVANGETVLVFPVKPTDPHLTIPGFQNATAVAIDDRSFIYVVDRWADDLGASIRSFSLGPTGQPTPLFDTGITGINPCGGITIGPDYDPPPPPRTRLQSLEAMSLLMKDIADDGLLRGPGGGILPGPHEPGGPLLDMLVGLSAHRLAGLSSSRDAAILQRAAMSLVALSSQKEIERLNALVAELEGEVR